MARIVLDMHSRGMRSKAGTVAEINLKSAIPDIEHKDACIGKMVAKRRIRELSLHHQREGTQPSGQLRGGSPLHKMNEVRCTHRNAQQKK